MPSQAFCPADVAVRMGAVWVRYGYVWCMLFSGYFCWVLCGRFWFVYFLIQLRGRWQIVSVGVCISYRYTLHSVGVVFRFSVGVFKGHDPVVV